MGDIQVPNYMEMQNYTGYPTPPSTNEDSPLSVHLLSSPSYVSESSTSPVHFPNQQLVFLAPNYSIAPAQTFDPDLNNDPKEIPPCLRIIEQPLDKFRFRYKSEMTGTHGSLNGETSDKTRKMTYPTVELCNYPGSAVIRCSIWQINHNGDDFMPHAHRLVKKKHGKEEADDPHDMEVNQESTYQATFHSMGIIHTAKKNIVTELIKKKTKLKREAVAREGRKDINKKEELEIKGLAEAESKSINLNVVCLRFDAFYVGLHNIYFPLCPPVFSHAINNLKSALTGELKIVRMDHCTSPANGGREIFLLVERVTKKNIKVRFFELDDDDNLLWEDYGKFNDLDVHHQYAIVLRTPPYRNRDINTQVNVHMELIRPSDSARSDSKIFTYTPMANHGRPGAKRSRPSDFDSNDYDTPLSIGSDILPTTIHNISGEFNILKLTENVDSEELRMAVNDIDSDEFAKLYATFGTEYESAGLVPSDNTFSNLSVDFSTMRNNQQKKIIGTSGIIEPYTFNKEYESKILRVYHEISEFLKTQPKIHEIKKKLRHYFVNCKDESNLLNAFHMAVMVNNSKIINFFVQLVYLTQELDLINIESQKLGTVLHLATLCKNVELISTLISTCQADISKKDAGLNTPLHIAAVVDSSGHLMQALLRAKNAAKCIDLENEHGDTALHRAVKKKNLRAAQILCKCGADVDYRHHSNGYTPLRFAVENDDFEMITFLLNEGKANPKVRDFTEVDPLQVVRHNQTPPAIRDVVEKYMSDNKISCDEISIKEEPEDDTSEDEMVIFEGDIKVEPLPLLDLQSSYQGVTSFSSECLEEVSKELDASGKWYDLAVLLDVEHLLKMQTFDEKKSPSKQLLNYIVASNGGSIKEIRDFLENLDEAKAVDAIDKMVQEINSCSS